VCVWVGGGGAGSSIHAHTRETGRSRLATCTAVFTSNPARESWRERVGDKESEREKERESARALALIRQESVCARGRVCVHERENERVSASEKERGRACAEGERAHEREVEQQEPCLPLIKHEYC
jgi:hypothetical protein